MIAPSPFPWPKSANSAESRKRAKRPNCPQCGSRLLLAERSRFNVAGRIDNFWACDDCGTECATSIEIAHRAVA
jgi:DNA-directed RNA polymerase subunit RPC12/RpoP